MLQERFWDKVDRRDPSECWEWTAAVGSHGYGVINLDGDRTETAHRVAFYLEHDRWPEYVLHDCDNKLCVNPDHIREGTHSENIKLAYDAGAKEPPRVEGESHPGSKLTGGDVREIRDRGSESSYALAEEYGVSATRIQQIWNGDAWTHVD